jgi:tape measure domain-containing protein
MAVFKIGLDVTGARELSSLDQSLKKTENTAKLAGIQLEKLQNQARKASEEVARLKKENDTTAAGTERLNAALLKEREALAKVAVAADNVADKTEKIGDINDKTAKSSDILATSMRSLVGVFALIGTVETAKKLIEMSDAMTRLDGRLKLATSSMSEFTSQQRELLKIANEAYVPLQGVTDLFVKLDPSLKDMGASTASVNAIVKTFTQGLKMGGATTAESASAILQFGQAMGSGVLRGEEFNSVLEASPKLMRYLAEGLEVPFGSLRKLAEQGELTAGKVSAALLKMRDRIEADFKSMPVTVADSLQVLKNDMAKLVQETDKAMGATAALSDVIQGFTKIINGQNETFNEYLPLLQAAAVTYGTLKAASMASAVAENTLEALRKKSIITTVLYDATLMTNVTTQTTLTAAQTAGAVASSALNAALRAIPFVAVAGAVGGLATMFFEAKKQSDDLTDSIIATVEALSKLSSAQLSNKRQNIALSAQEISLERRRLELKYGSRSGRTASQQSEIDDLRQQEDQMREAMKKVASVQTDMRNGSKANVKQNKSESDSLDEIIKKLENYKVAAAGKAGGKGGKAGGKGGKTLADYIEKARLDAIESNAEREKELMLSVYNAELSAMQFNADRRADIALEVYNSTISDIERLNDIVVDKYNLAAEMFPEGIPDEWFKKINGEYEKLKQIVDPKDFEISVSFKGYDKISNSLADIANSIVDMDKAQTQYEKNKAKYADNSEALAKNELQNQQAKIAGYSNMIGAVAGFYSAESTQAKKLHQLQQVMQMSMMAMELSKMGVLSTNAMLFSLQAPPPANFAAFAATAALVASLGIVIGGAIAGGDKSTTSSDAFSAMAANTGAGSILGDTAAQSESIAKALDIMGDLAKPEFALMSQMTKSLQSIDQKIGGVTSLLLRQGGFAFGEGYEGFDTGFKNNLGSGASGIIATGASIAGLGMAGGAALGLGNIAALGNLTPVGIIAMIADKFLLGGAFSNMINGIVGSVIGGLFGKTSVNQTMTDSGIYFANALLEDAINSFNGSAYQTIATTVTKKSWFSKSSSTTISTYFGALDDEVGRQFSLVLSGLYDATVMAGAALDTSALDIEKGLSDFVVSIGKISLKGKTGDEIQETLSSVFGKIADDIAKESFPLLIPFQKVGEGLFETMGRVAMGMEEAEYYISRLGNAFADIKYTEIIDKQGNVGLEALRQSILGLADDFTGITEIVRNFNGEVEELYTTYAALDQLTFALEAIGTTAFGLTSAMLYGAGGISQLAGAAESYIDNFLTDAEKVAYQIAVMSDAFADLGLMLPKTKKEFSDLLKSIDVTTASGQELYGRVITLADGFNDLTKSLEDQQGIIFGMVDVFDSLRKSSKRLIDSLSRTGGQDDVKAYLIKYNDLKAQFMSAFDPETGLVYKEKMDEMQSVYGELSSVVSGLSGVGSTAQKSALIGEISGFDAMFEDNQQSIIDVLNHINANQATDKTLTRIDKWMEGLYNAQVEAAGKVQGFATTDDDLGYKGIGFASGGYTGDIPTNAVAGVVHGKEYVINAKTTKDLGINNSGGLFQDMLKAMRSMESRMAKMEQLAMNQLREIIGGNIIMRQVTNGGNAMVIEVL